MGRRAAIAMSHPELFWAAHVAQLLRVLSSGTCMGACRRSQYGEMPYDDDGRAPTAVHMR